MKRTSFLKATFSARVWVRSKFFFNLFGKVFTYFLFGCYQGMTYQDYVDQVKEDLKSLSPPEEVYSRVASAMMNRDIQAINDLAKLKAEMNPDLAKEKFEIVIDKLLKAEASAKMAQDKVFLDFEIAKKDIGRKFELTTAFYQSALSLPSMRFVLIFFNFIIIICFTYNC